MPLLIGGATTSRIHTSLRIDPPTHGPVVHVADASRASGVISQPDVDGPQRDGFLADLEVEYAARDRVAQAGRRRAQPDLDRTGAGQPASGRRSTPPRCTAPTFTGAARVRRLSTSPNSCRTSTGRRSSARGASARGSPRCSPTPSSPTPRGRCTTTRWRCSTRSSSDHWFRPKAVVGIWPANAGTGDDVDDIVVFADDARTEVLATLHGLRQQAARTGDRPNCSISDFVAPIDSGVADSRRARSW